MLQRNDFKFHSSQLTIENRFYDSCHVRFKQKQTFKYLPLVATAAGFSGILSVFIDKSIYHLLFITLYKLY